MSLDFLIAARQFLDWNEEKRRTEKWYTCKFCHKRFLDHYEFCGVKIMGTHRMDHWWHWHEDPTDPKSYFWGKRDKRWLHGHVYQSIEANYAVDPPVLVLACSLCGRTQPDIERVESEAF